MAAAPDAELMAALLERTRRLGLAALTALPGPASWPPPQLAVGLLAAVEELAAATTANKSATRSHPPLHMYNSRFIP